MKPRITDSAWVLPVVALFICGAGGERLGTVEYSHRVVAAGPSGEGSSSPNLVLAQKKKPKRSAPTGVSPTQGEGARKRVEQQGTGRALAVTTHELVVSSRPLGKSNSFRSIKSALDHASTNGLRMIRVTVHPGRYSGELQITRPTAINGTDPNGIFVLGSISNPDGHRLTLSNLRMRDCRPYALVQRGGSLTLKDFSVSSTRRTPKGPDSGVAIDVSGGVVGRFTNVTLDSNEGTALRVRGNETSVTAFHLTATNNRKSGVEVADGALLLAMNPVIENNRYVGVLVRDRGKAHLASGRVTRTGEDPERGDQAGGHNVAARYRSKVELRNMWIAHGALTGIQSVESWVKVTGTIIEHNLIGANIQGSAGPGYDQWTCILLGGTEFRNNERDFDSAAMPVPDTALPTDWLQDGGGQPSAEQEPDCPGVPWESRPGS